MLALPYASCATLRLTWSDRSDNENGFWIERSADGSHFSEVGESAPNEASFADETVVSGNRYYYRVQAFNEYGASEYSEVVSALVESEETQLEIQGSPKSSLIGEMSSPGESVFHVGARAFALSASGAGYEGYLDELRFTHVEAEGDFRLRVRVHTFEPDDSWARVGLMARESLGQDARHESIVLNGKGYIERLSRVTTGLRVAATEQLPAGPYVFLEIERQGGVVSLSYSFDGKVWDKVSGEANEMGGRIQVGMTIGSQRDGHLSAALVEVIESDLKGFSQCTSEWPYLLGQPIEEALIGEMDLVGSYHYDSSSCIHSMEAAGVGYERYADELRYSKVTVSGDLDFAVKLSKFAPDASWGRAGIMVRSSLDPQAAHFSVAVTGTDRFETLIRASDGDPVTTLRTEMAPSVAYLRIKKEGSWLRGYSSVDGIEWLLIDEAEISLGEAFEVGLAIGSQYDGQISRALFEVVSESAEPNEDVPGALALLGQAAETSIIGTMADEGTDFYDESTGLYFFSASGAGYERYDDELRYTRVPASGDFSLKVAIHDYEADAAWSRVGIMVRDSLEPNAKHVSVALTGHGYFESLVRHFSGERVETTRYGLAGSTPQLRMERFGNRLKLSVADEGGHWRPINELEMSLGPDAMVGLVIGSQADGDLSSCVLELLD